MYILNGMRTRVQRWGNSLALRIPKPLAEEVGLQTADEVEISLDNGELRVTPARRRWRLETLVSKITRKNAHSEIETGPVRGREAW
jgi:antitoxin MazE